MIINRYTLPVTLVALLLSLSGCTSLQPSEVSHDGMTLVSTKPMDAVYRKPDADLSSYQRFMVGECSVAFKKNWQRDQNSTVRSPSRRISDDDMAKTKAKLGELCREVFIEELQRDGGYQVVDTAGADVLELRPAIFDLDINAPDPMAPGRSTTYTTSAGSMSLYLEAYDSVTGEILGRAIDKRKVPDSGRLEWTNSVTNARDAKRILRYWGSALRDMVDSTRQP